MRRDDWPSRRCASRPWKYPASKVGTARDGHADPGTDPPRGRTPRRDARAPNGGPDSKWSRRFRASSSEGVALLRERRDAERLRLDEASRRPRNVVNPAPECRRYPVVKEGTDCQLIRSRGGCSASQDGGERVTRGGRCDTSTEVRDGRLGRSGRATRRTRRPCP